jgi:hypothetical protein
LLTALSLAWQAKVSFDNETRVMHLANSVTYAELLENMKVKFPHAYPFQIKYLDRFAPAQPLSPLPGQSIHVLCSSMRCLEFLDRCLTALAAFSSACLLNQRFSTSWSVCHIWFVDKSLTALV